MDSTPGERTMRVLVGGPRCVVVEDVTGKPRSIRDIEFILPQDEWVKLKRLAVDKSGELFTLEEEVKVPSIRYITEADVTNTLEEREIEALTGRKAHRDPHQIKPVECARYWYVYAGWVLLENTPEGSVRYEIFLMRGQTFMQFRRELHDALGWQFVRAIRDLFPER